MTFYMNINFPKTQMQVSQKECSIPLEIDIRRRRTLCVVKDETFEISFFLGSIQISSFSKTVVPCYKFEIKTFAKYTSIYQCFFSICVLERVPDLLVSKILCILMKYY